MRSGRDSTDFESDEQDFCWVSYFLSKQENDFFCRIDESYLHDSFNLHGIQPQIPYYDWALDLVKKKKEEDRNAKACAEFFSLKV